MVNFIDEFLKKKVLKNVNNEKQTSNFSTHFSDKIEDKQEEKMLIEDFEKKDTKNSNFDKKENLLKEKDDDLLIDLESLENNKGNDTLKTKKKIMDKTKGEKKILIEKKSYKQEIKWIFIQFFLGIILIVVSTLYIQKHETEKRFFDSSIAFWKGIVVKIYSLLGGTFKKQVDEDYIEKRANMIKKISLLGKKLDSCILTEKNKNTKLELKRMKTEIEGLKSKLLDTKSFPLEQYIDKYQHISLFLHSWEKGIDKYCNK